MRVTTLIYNIKDNRDAPIYWFMRRAEDTRALALLRIQLHQLCNAAPRYTEPTRRLLS